MKINYKIEGTPNSPVLVFSNSLGSTLHMWDALTPLLTPYFRVLRYDTRGHGGSVGTIDAALSIADLGGDVIALLDQLGIASAHFCGLSMGGLIGQWLGIHHPDRIKKLILSNTGAKIGSDETWNARIATIRAEGMGAIVDATIERWFTEAFRQNSPDRAADTRAMFLGADPEGYAACCGAIRDADFRERLSQIKPETLVVTGDEDPVTNVEHAKFLTENIPNARLEVLKARHLSAAELPEQYAELLLDFIVGERTFERGMHVRRTVLGDAHVDRANANINEFNADFQRFITHYAWGEIWTRPGLPKRERSLITVAMLIALNRSVELKMHLKAAFNNGVTKEELKELILQAAVYCGVPAANDAFHAAAEILKEIEQ